MRRAAFADLLRRVQPVRLEADQRRIADHLPTRRARAGRQGRPVPEARRRSVSGGPRRQAGVGGRRLHDDQPVPERRVGRHPPAPGRQRVAQLVQLRPQLGEGRRRCLRRHGHAVRRRSDRSDHHGVAEGVPRSVHARRPRCPPSCASTSGIPRICSGSRPTSTAGTSSRTPSSSTPSKLAWSVAQAAPDRQVGHGTGPRRPRRCPDNDERPTPRAGPPMLDTARFEPYYTLFRAPGRRRLGVRAVPAVRAVLDRTTNARSSGVHDGVERARELREAHRLRRSQRQRPIGPLTVATRTSARSSPRSSRCSTRRAPRWCSAISSSCRSVTG